MGFSAFSNKWTDDFLDAKRRVTDPYADGVVKKLIDTEGIEASRQLFDQMIRNIDLPSGKLPGVIQEYFSSEIVIPSWLTPKDINNTHNLFLDHGPKMLLLLYYKSLPLLYNDVKGARVLIRTGRLAHSGDDMEIFARRIAETGQFLVYVMMKDALKPGSIGMTTIRKVRLIHAAIRHFVKLGDWNTEDSGEPINQEDMALTLMSFSISLTDGLRQLGIHESDELTESFLEYWKAIGIQLGINEDVLPDDPTDARELLNKILERQAGPSDEGKLLAKALTGFSARVIPGKKLDVAPELIMRYLIGDEFSDNLDIKTAGGCAGKLIPGFLAGFFNLVEKLEDDSPKIRHISDVLSVHLVKGLIGFFDHYKNRYFEVPEEFKTGWNIDS